MIIDKDKLIVYRNHLICYIGGFGFYIFNDSHVELEGDWKCRSCVKPCCSDGELHKEQMQPASRSD
jgi:hypothetical protein